MDDKSVDENSNLKDTVNEVENSFVQDDRSKKVSQANKSIIDSDQTDSKSAQDSAVEFSHNGQSGDGNYIENIQASTSSVSENPSVPDSVYRLVRSRSGSLGRHHSVSRSLSASRSRTRSWSRSRSGSRSKEYSDRSRSPSYSRGPRKRRYSSEFSRSPSRSRARSRERSAKIIVECVTTKTTSRHIREIFGAYGKINIVDFGPTRQGDGLSPVYIIFEDPDEARSAVDHMDGGMIDLVNVTVRIISPQRMKMARTDNFGRTSRGWGSQDQRRGWNVSDKTTIDDQQGRGRKRMGRFNRDRRVNERLRYDDEFDHHSDRRYSPSNSRRHSSSKRRSWEGAPISADRRWSRSRSRSISRSRAKSRSYTPPPKRSYA